jgi:hypothetical protein
MSEIRGGRNDTPTLPQEDAMKRALLSLTLLLALLPLGAPASAAPRVRVVHRGPRAVVRVHTGFPIVRPLPHVYVRPAAVAVRVAPRVFLPPVVFGAVVVASTPAADTVVWHGSEDLERDDEWTEVTMNIDHRGRALLLEVGGGEAQVSFAEVVFENGDTQVVDFADRQHRTGLYNLLDFKDGRKVDHVRVVAKSVGDEAQITVRLLA